MFRVFTEVSDEENAYSTNKDAYIRKNCHVLIMSPSFPFCTRYTVCMIKAWPKYAPLCLMSGGL